jgi:hypothetical protein
MKIKHLIIVSLLLAILTIGVVSASEDVDDLTADNDDSMSVDDGDAVVQDDEGENEDQRSDDVDVTLNDYDEDSGEGAIDLSEDTDLAEIDVAKDATGNVSVIFVDGENQNTVFEKDISQLGTEFDNESEIGSYFLKLGELDNFADLTFGSYYVIIKYAGDDKYQPADDEGTIMLINATDPVVEDKDYVDYNFYVPEVALIGKNYGFSYYIYYGENFPSGNVSFILDDETVLVNLPIDYYGSYQFEDYEISEGYHTLKMKYTGDEYYYGFETEEDFLYTTFAIDFPDEVLLGGYDNDFTLYFSDSSGRIILKVDGKEEVNELISDLIYEEGQSYVRFDIGELDLSLGEHNYTVIYLAKDGSNVTENGTFDVDYIFDVYCEQYEEGGHVYYGDDVYFDVRLPSDAEGNISVIVNGKTLTFKYDPSKYMVISNLSIGENELNFTYSGDKKYPSKSDEYDIFVSSRIVVPDEFTYKGDEVIELTLPDDAEGNLTVYYAEYDQESGNTIAGEIIKTVPLKDGKASISLSDLPFGGYDIYVEYTGDDYDVSSVSENIKVLPKVTYEEYEWINGNYTITIESPDDIEGNYTAVLYKDSYYDYENDVYVPEEYIDFFNCSAKGTNTKDMPKLEAGIYSIILSYIIDDTTVFVESYYLKVNANSPEWTFNATFPEEINKYRTEYIPRYLGNLPYDISGNVYLYIDDKLYEDGWYSYDDGYDRDTYGNLSSLSFGTHTWKVFFEPSFYYKNATDEGTFEVTWITMPKEIIGQEYIYFDNNDENATGYLSISIDGKDYAMEFVDGGYAVISLENLAVGTHTYEVIYSGDKTHEKLTKSGSFEVLSLFDINIEEGDDLYLKESYHIYVGLPEDATGSVFVSVGGKNYTAEVVNGSAEVNVEGLTEGAYTIVVKYSGDSKYPADELSRNFTISYYQIEKIFNDDGKIIAVSIMLPPNASGNLSVYEYGSLLKTVKVENGKAEILTADLELSFGKHVLDAYYEYDENYTDVGYAWFEYGKYPEITVPEQIITGESAEIIVDFGENVTGNITVYLNREVFQTVEISNGKINVTVSADNLTLGENIISFDSNDFDESVFGHYGDDGYELDKYLISVELKNMTIPEELGSDGKGNITMDVPASGNVSVYVNGELASTTPVTAGNNTIPLDLPAGDNNVKVVYESDDGQRIVSSSDVYVPKPEASVNITASTDKKVPEFTVTLPNNATGSLIVNVDGNNYAADLVNGSATIAIPGLADGNHNVTVRYTGDKTYEPFVKSTNVTSKAAVDPKIDASDLKVIYTDGSKYTVTVYGTDGNVAANTEVTFLVNGKIFKTVTTDANGTASVVINQKPGNYKITTKALGIEVTKKLTVQHVLKLKKVKVKRSAKKLVIKVTLSKVNGKYLKGKKITFKFNGKKLKAKKTNKKGVAKFTIKKKLLKKLKKGKKVKYQATYLKDTVKKTVKVKK